MDKTLEWLRQQVTYCESQIKDRSEKRDNSVAYTNKLNIEIKEYETQLKTFKAQTEDLKKYSVED